MNDSRIKEAIKDILKIYRVPTVVKVARSVKKNSLRSTTTDLFGGDFKSVLLYRRSDKWYRTNKFDLVSVQLEHKTLGDIYNIKLSFPRIDETQFNWDEGDIKRLCVQQKWETYENLLKKGIQFK